MSTFQHRQKSPRHIKIAIMGVSSTRSVSEDKSGAWMKKQAKKEGHEVAVHHAVADEIDTIREMVAHLVEKVAPDAILVSGGTGITKKDVTYEAVHPLFEKELTSFGPLFAGLSYEEIDSAALLSRATAGIIRNTVLFCMPGSLGACKLACKALVFPELGHIVKHVKE